MGEFPHCMMRWKEKPIPLPSLINVWLALVDQRSSIRALKSTGKRAKIEL